MKIKEYGRSRYTYRLVTRRFLHVKRLILYVCFPPIPVISERRLDWLLLAHGRLSALPLILIYQRNILTRVATGPCERSIVAVHYLNSRFRSIGCISYNITDRHAGYQKRCYSLFIGFQCYHFCVENKHLSKFTIFYSNTSVDGTTI